MKKITKNIISFFSALSLTMSLSLSSFLFLITLGFSLNLMTPTNSKADEVDRCDTIDGKIVIGELDDTPVRYGDSGDYDVDSCSREPLYYKIVLYEAKLCTEDPYKGYNVVPDFSSCKATLLDEQKEVELQPGIEVPILDGDDLILPIGSYKYAAVILSNHIGIKHYEQFVDTNGASIDLSGLGAGTAYTEGEYCFTVNKTTTYSATDGSGSDGHGTSPHVASDGTSRTYIVLDNLQDPTKFAVKCKTGSIPTASDGYDYSYEIIDSLDKRGTEAGSAQCDEDDNCNSTFGTGEVITKEDLFEDEGLEIDGDARFNLLQNSNALATDRADAKKIAYMMNLVTPIKITEQTASFKMEFSTSSSVSVDFDFSDGGKTGGDNVKLLKMGADPFHIKFKTKEKRRGRLRDWR
jgi:hypothetical protein